MKIAFAGGGCLFFMHLGVIAALREVGVYIEEVSGTSAGALAAAVLCSDLKPGKETNDLVSRLFPMEKKIVSVSWTSLFRNYGFMDLRKLEMELSHIVPKTFADCRYPLTIYTSNIDKQELGVWSTKETPNQSVSKRVTDSCRIPGVFVNAVIDGDVHTDGGLMKNYPIDTWDSLDGCESREDVLGVRFDGTLAGPLPPKGGFFAPMRNLVRHFAGHVSLAMKQTTMESIEDAYGAQELVLSVPGHLQEQGINGLSFDMTEPQALELIEAGKNQALAFFRKRNV